MARDVGGKRADDRSLAWHASSKDKTCTMNLLHRSPITVFPFSGTAGIGRAVGLGFVMLRVRHWLQEIQAKHDL
jgi:hypothetical protein